jgi:colicin import membrane protein
MEPVRTDRLGSAITWSLVAHGAIALFVVVKSLVFPGNPILVAPALRVDVVGLPDILKKDLSQVSKSLPQEALKEQLEDAAKQAQAVKPVEVPKEAPAAKDEMVLNPKKLDKKAEKIEDAKREKKLESALARIRALERLKDKEETEREEANDAVVIKGNQVSKGTSLSGDARESAEAGYYDLVRERLIEFWSLPPWLSRQKLAAQVLITVDGAGNILSVKFVKTSGNPQFDEAIRATLRDSQPLPKPPAKIASTVSSEGIVVGFPL